MNPLSHTFKRKLELFFYLDSNNFGVDWVTKLYARAAKKLSIAPFIFIIPLALIFSLLCYVIFGILIIKLTSLLQYGF